MRQFEDILNDLISSCDRSFNTGSYDVKLLILEYAARIYIKEMELDAYSRLVHQTRPLSSNTKSMMEKALEEGLGGIMHGQTAQN